MQGRKLEILCAFFKEKISSVIICSSARHFLFLGTQMDVHIDILNQYNESNIIETGIFHCMEKKKKLTKYISKNVRQ